jgi:inorganic triphosphatase YgiF
MEIEAKYRVEAADLGIVATLQNLGIYHLEPAPAPEQQENVYYDTVDARLTAARYGLRVRRVGSRSLITLKGPAEVAADGVHRRSEFEFPGTNPQPTTWPAGVARELALALTGGATLVPTVTIKTQRQVLYAQREGVPVAELCLDHGMLGVGAYEQPFSELEIELLSEGVHEDLVALASALSLHITLTPEPRTKLQRALELRAHA